jgi:hypothetical protein
VESLSSTSHLASPSQQASSDSQAAAMTRSSVRRLYCSARLLRRYLLWQPCHAASLPPALYLSCSQPATSHINPCHAASLPPAHALSCIQPATSTILATQPACQQHISCHAASLPTTLYLSCSQPAIHTEAVSLPESYPAATETHYICIHAATMVLFAPLLYPQSHAP